MEETRKPSIFTELEYEIRRGFPHVFRNLTEQAPSADPGNYIEIEFRQRELKPFELNTAFDYLVENYQRSKKAAADVFIGMEKTQPYTPERDDAMLKLELMTNRAKVSLDRVIEIFYGGKERLGSAFDSEGNPAYFYNRRCVVFPIYLALAEVEVMNKRLYIVKEFPTSYKLVIDQIQTEHLLKKAVKNEKYEKAASLKKKLDRLEVKISEI